MSRSFRKNPFIGITTSSSEKQEKKQANRRLRHTVRQRLGEDSDNAGLPVLRDVSSRWWMSKDGKFRFCISDCPWLMRK